MFLRKSFLKIVRKCIYCTYIKKIGAYGPSTLYTKKKITTLCPRSESSTICRSNSGKKVYSWRPEDIRVRRNYLPMFHFSHMRSEQNRKLPAVPYSWRTYVETTLFLFLIRFQIFKNQQHTIISRCDACNGMLQTMYLSPVFTDKSIKLNTVIIILFPCHLIWCNSPLA